MGRVICSSSGMSVYRRASSSVSLQVKTKAVCANERLCACVYVIREGKYCCDALAKSG